MQLDLKITQHLRHLDLLRLYLSHKLVSKTNEEDVYLSVKLIDTNKFLYKMSMMIIKQI